MVTLTLLGVSASFIGRLGVGREVVVAAVRAAAQLAVVSLIITAAIAQLWSTLAFVALMFTVAVVTTIRRVGAVEAWPWSALAMACGALPVLLIIFGTGAAPFTPVAVLSLAGIVIGNMMTGHTLAGRRCFAELTNNIPSYEAGLSLGLTRGQSIGEVIERVAAEAMVPILDQTRTVGLVTLPGAFIGVLLGGGSPLQAGATQVLVLVGVTAGQAVTVAVATAFMRRAHLLPVTLAAKLRP
ncbi:MAG: ABC transporter permease [Micropruina sp.]|nr:ABC transporter permease [Micropruina sp.]